MSDFNISTAESGQFFIIRTNGYLNENTGQLLKQTCDEALSKGKTKIIFNFSSTPIINSTALSMLLEIIVQIVDYNDGVAVVVGLSKLVKTAFQMTGLLSLCKYYETEEDALANLSK